MHVTKAVAYVLNGLSRLNIDQNSNPDSNNGYESEASDESSIGIIKNPPTICMCHNVLLVNSLSGTKAKI